MPLLHPAATLEMHLHADVLQRLAAAGGPPARRGRDTLTWSWTKARGQGHEQYEHEDRDRDRCKGSMSGAGDINSRVFERGKVSKTRRCASGLHAVLRLAGCADLLCCLNIHGC